MKVGIVGFGFVGQALYSSFKDKENTSILDPLKGYVNEIFTSDIVFICVGTPENDFSEVRKILKSLEDSEYKGIVVVKSTVPSKYINHFNLNVVANPEFLNQISAESDFKNQKYVVLGGNRDLTWKVEKFYKEHTLINPKTYEHCTIDEAMNFKYIRNIYGAYKVLFWNYVEEVFGNSRKMSKMLEEIPQGEMSLVGLDGKLGYGGACFVKDVNSTHTESSHELTDFMIKYNGRLNDN